MRTGRTTRFAILLAAFGVWSAAAYAAPAPQDPATEIPRDPTFDRYEVQGYPLSAGAVLEHEQYRGVVRTRDASGREIARAKVPKAKFIESSTTLVLSSDRSRVLVVHRADDFKFQAKHRVAILDSARLRTLAELPLGKCSSPNAPYQLPVATEYLTMLCYHSRPPGDASRKPTLAVVTLNLNTGEVVRWFSLGGKRRGSWFGPMFFGWTYDVWSVDVDSGRCPSLDDDPSVPPAGEDADYPYQIVVLRKDSEPASGEVWFVSARPSEPPRRVAVLSGKPARAHICHRSGTQTDADRGRLLYVIEESDAARPGRPGGVFRTAAGEPVEILDMSTGRLLVR